MISFNPFLYFLFFPCSSRFALRRFEDGADLTWLGQLTEAERLIINMLKNVVFRSGHDSQLRNTLKGSTLPADILCHDPFKTMMETIHEEIEKVKAAEEKEANEDESDEDSPAQKNVIVHDLLPRMSLELDHEDEKAQQLMAFAKQAEEIVDQFVKLVVEQDSVQAMGQIMENCVSLTGAKRAIFVYDSKVAGEATAQCHIRRPQFRREHFQKICSSFVRGRGGPQPREGDLVIFFDGGRQLAPMVLSACVKITNAEDHGQHWEKKQRQEMIIHYCEQSIRARRCLVRGLIPTHEGIHIVTSGPVLVQDIPRKIFSGTSLSTAIGPVKILPFDEEQGFWLISKEEKDKIYGPAGRVLSGGALPDCPDRPDLGEDRIPVNYHVMPQAVFAELLHSFQASVMVNGTEIDGKGAEAAILAKKSYIGVTFTEYHAQQLRKLLVRFVWEQFKDQSSPLYNVEVCLGHKWNNNK